MPSSICCRRLVFRLSSATYAPQYNDAFYGFPHAKWYDNVWFTNTQQEFQMMLVVSWADMVSRLIFALGLLQCMESIKDILTPIEPAQATNTAIVPTSTEIPRPTSTPPRTTRWFRWIPRFLEKGTLPCFMMLGFAIFVVHIVSETRDSVMHMPCQLVLHPWFVTKPACALVELDCYQLGKISGSQASLETAWNTFDFSSAVRIYIRHCPALEIPPAIQQYHHLTAITLYNCTITSWSESAALTSTIHPTMPSLLACRTNFPNGELPAGLTSTTFPTQFLNFVTSVTNLYTLPDHLHERWPPGMTLIFEESQMRMIPSSLIQLNTLGLSFAKNPIVFVPSELFESPLLSCITLSYTRIQEIPRIVPNLTPSLFMMFLEGTNISTFWSWMDPFIQHALPYDHLFNAYGSPYCEQRNEILAGHRTHFTSTDDFDLHDLASIMDVSTPAKLAFSLTAIKCERTDYFYFPPEFLDSTSAIQKIEST